MDDPLLIEFDSLLCDLSYARAGDDYQLPLTQKQGENRLRQTSLSRLREIWRDHPDRQVELGRVFKALGPLATLDELERTS